jgi:NAD(P)-dependent dehydrogenase (short-subunit alcohol dehydrogenase family)
MTEDQTVAGDAISGRPADGPAGLCAGRVVVVTGAGRGIGREYALAFAAAGARLVVNDTGAGLGGDGADSTPVQQVAEEIRAAGGEATVSQHDVSSEADAAALIELAISSYGQLDVLVNNAGILRDRTLVNMTTQEWDDVIAVHLRGTFLLSRGAARHWRQRSKDTGQPSQGRLINVTSASGLYGNLGQSNYGAAKAGIAAFTVITAMELDRYGATVNAIAPGARTRMTLPLAKAADVAPSPDAFDYRDPANVAPLAVWLGSPDSAGVTGRVFNVMGGEISLAQGWRAGQVAAKEERWAAADLGPAISALLDAAEPQADMYGRLTR